MFGSGAVSGLSTKFDSAEFTHVEGKPVVPSMWFAAAPRPYVLCNVGVIAIVLGAAVRCGDAFAASCFQPFYVALLSLLVAMLVPAFSLRRTWNETGWTFMRSMFSVPSGGQAKNKECGKGKCFFAKWFMNVLVPQALTAACLAAAFYEMAKTFRKHAAACIGAWNVFLLLEGVYGAAAATVGLVTFGGDNCFSGAAVAHSNVCRPAAAKEGLIT